MLFPILQAEESFSPVEETTLYWGNSKKQEKFRPIWDLLRFPIPNHIRIVEEKLEKTTALVQAKTLNFQTDPKPKPKTILNKTQ